MSSGPLIFVQSWVSNPTPSTVHRIGTNRQGLALGSRRERNVDGPGSSGAPFYIGRPPGCALGVRYSGPARPISPHSSAASYFGRDPAGKRRLVWFLGLLHTKECGSLPPGRGPDGDPWLLGGSCSWVLGVRGQPV